MPLIRVSEASVKTMLLKVDTFKAWSRCFKPKVLKSCAEVLSPSMMTLFNKSLSQDEIPDAWREAIVPIHKKSSKSDKELSSSFFNIFSLKIIRKYSETTISDPFK